MSQDMAKQIDVYLQANLDAYIDETAQLCAQPSVSATGEGIRACAELVAGTLARRGFDVQTLRTPGSPVVVAHLDGASDRTLLLYNHYDVQPVDPIDLWTSPPFEPTIRDGALYARGAVDDKGEIIARLAAIDALLAVHGGTLPCGVTFVVEGEEEVGSPHIAQFVEDHLDLLQCQGAIWEGGGINTEGHPDLVLGVRGILFVQLSVETMTRDAHSGAAHQLPNAAWRLLWALGSLKGPDERVRIPGFYDNVKPPSRLDLAYLDALPDPEEWYRAEHGVQGFIRGLAGPELNRAVFEPTCNVDGFTGGYQGEGNKTVIPARASAKVDFRLVPDQDPVDILAKLRAHLDTQGFQDVRIEPTGGMMWPAKAAADDALVTLTAETAEEVYGLPAVIHPMTGGSTPIYAFAARCGGPLGDVPVVTAGVGYPGARGHAPDEHMRLGDFLTGARHIARILDGFAALGDHLGSSGQVGSERRQSPGLSR